MHGAGAGALGGEGGAKRRVPCQPPDGLTVRWAAVCHTCETATCGLLWMFAETFGCKAFVSEIGAGKVRLRRRRLRWRAANHCKLQ